MFESRSKKDGGGFMKIHENMFKQFKKNGIIVEEITEELTFLSKLSIILQRVQAIRYALANYYSYATLFHSTENISNVKNQHLQMRYSSLKHINMSFTHVELSNLLAENSKGFNIQNIIKEIKNCYNEISNNSSLSDISLVSQKNYKQNINIIAKYTEEKKKHKKSIERLLELRKELFAHIDHNADTSLLNYYDLFSVFRFIEDFILNFIKINQYHLVDFDNINIEKNGNLILNGGLSEFVELILKVVVYEKYNEKISISEQEMIKIQTAITDTFKEYYQTS